MMNIVVYSIAKLELRVLRASENLALKNLSGWITLKSVFG